VADRTVTFDLLARDRASSTIDKVGDTAERSGGRFERLGNAAKVGGALLVGAAAGAGVLGVKLIDVAVNAEAMGNKARTVFGKDFAAAKAKADELSVALGMSTNETLALTAGFGDLLTPMGFSTSKAQTMSGEIGTLTAALTQWSGGTKSAADVGDILADALTGEYDSLKSLGVQIDADLIKQRLHEQGKDKLTGAALKQAEAEIALKEITSQSSNALNGYSDKTNKLGLAKLKLVSQVKNLRDSLAEKLLPLLASAATWLGDKLPGAIIWLKDAFTGLATAFSTKDPMGAWTDGFHKVQQAGYLARVAFDAIVPVVRKAFNALKSTAQFLIKYQDVIVPIAAGILAMVTAWKIYVTVVKVVAAVTKAWAAVQAVMNVVLAANPIGIIVLALVGLGVALVVAYRKSETFRAGVQTALRIVQLAFAGLLAAGKLALETLVRVFHTVKAAVENVLLDAFRVVVRSILGYLGFLINGAARAFGWIPGIGPKLKTAAAQFNQFAASVNSSLARIKNKQVYVTIHRNTIDYSDGRTRSRNGPNLMRAGGGGVTLGTRYLIGEHGPEMLTFTGAGSAAVTPAAQTSRQLRQIGTAGGVNVTVIVQGSVIRERDLARTVSENLQALLRSGTYVGLRST
jgi:hypothetical protein